MTTLRHSFLGEKKKFTGEKKAAQKRFFGGSEKPIFSFVRRVQRPLRQIGNSGTIFPKGGRRRGRIGIQLHKAFAPIHFVQTTVELPRPDTSAASRRTRPRPAGQAPLPDDDQVEGGGGGSKCLVEFSIALTHVLLQGHLVKAHTHRVSRRFLRPLRGCN